MKKGLSEVSHLFNERQTKRILNTRNVSLTGLREWYAISNGILVDADIDKEIIDIMEVNKISEINCTT
jgi:hypothetical protein